LSNRQNRVGNGQLERRRSEQNVGIHGEESGRIVEVQTAERGESEFIEDGDDGRQFDFFNIDRRALRHTFGVGNLKHAARGIEQLVGNGSLENRRRQDRVRIAKERRRIDGSRETIEIIEAHGIQSDEQGVNFKRRDVRLDVGIGSDGQANRDTGFGVGWNRQRAAFDGDQLVGNRLMQDCRR